MGQLNSQEKNHKKIDDLCTELGNHNITLAAISEHRWRGEGTYSVNEHWKFIYSGLPAHAPKAQSGVGFWYTLRCGGRGGTQANTVTCKGHN